MFQLILVPWDASAPSDRALDIALQLAEGYDAAIIALSVVTPSGPDAEARIAAFEEVRAMAERRDVTISHEVVTGTDPARAVQGFAHQHGADLVVIGHHSQHPAGVLSLHGVTEHLVSECDVPLLVVPAPPRPDNDPARSVRSGSAPRRTPASPISLPASDEARSNRGGRR